MRPDERPGIPHNVLAHPLLPLPGLWRLGEWLHRRTQEVVMKRTYRLNIDWSGELTR